jgi:hypothetical protein
MRSGRARSSASQEPEPRTKRDRHFGGAAQVRTPIVFLDWFFKMRGR